MHVGHAIVGHVGSLAAGDFEAWCLLAAAHTFPLLGTRLALRTCYPTVVICTKTAHRLLLRLFPCNGYLATLQGAVTELRGVFQDDKTCVIHGDLHHGSVMIDTAPTSSGKVRPPAPRRRHRRCRAAPATGCAC